MDRLKYLIQAIGYSTFVVIFAWYFYSSFSKGYDLSINGKVAVAEVVDYEYEETQGRKGKTNKYYKHKIKYNTHEKWIDLGKQHKVFSKFYVTYSSKQPLNITLGREKLTAFEYFKNDIGSFILTVGSILMFLGLYVVFDCIKLLIKPPQKEISLATNLGENQETKTPKELSSYQRKQKSIQSKERLLLPLKKSAVAFVLTFILMCTFGDIQNDFLQSIQTILIISFCVFIFVYLSLYKSK